MGAAGVLIGSRLATTGRCGGTCGLRPPPLLAAGRTGRVGLDYWTLRGAGRAGHSGAVACFIQGISTSNGFAGAQGPGAAGRTGHRQQRAGAGGLGRPWPATRPPEAVPTAGRPKGPKGRCEGRREEWGSPTERACHTAGPRPARRRPSVDPRPAPAPQGRIRRTSRVASVGERVGASLRAAQQLEGSGGAGDTSDTSDPSTHLGTALLRASNL